MSAPLALAIIQSVHQPLPVLLLESVLIYCLWIALRRRSE